MNNIFSSNKIIIEEILHFVLSYQIKKSSTLQLSLLKKYFILFLILKVVLHFISYQYKSIALYISIL